MKEKELHNLLGKIEPRILETEIQQSYLSYAMSVIVGRALPDVRDGLKPVHRRVLYAMGAMGLRSNVKYRKSANVVGEVMAKYHPHGDMAIYDTVVRMAQDFAMRYPLVDGQGNFGSIDGDSAAAQRYTECRMTKMTEDMLADIDKQTVDFTPNYDDTRLEPKVLPAKVPQLFLNGSVGIAVGMATNIPPHNLGELLDAVVLLIDNPEAEIDELMKHIPGPDFPTGGIIYNPGEIKQAYTTGRGSIVIRAVAEIEEASKGFRIIVSEIPYQVNKSVLIEKIADLVKNKKIIGISDLRDESDKDGIRIVVELRKDAYPKKVLNQLFKMTSMQTAFHVNILALIDGIQPEVLSLKSGLEHFIIHRQKVITRRTQYELTKAQERAHILEGLKIALDNLDAVITTIKKSHTKEDAHTNLMKKFKLSDLQASAILEMRLSALAGLEREKVENEYKEKQISIKELKSILADPARILSIIREESLELKEKYKDDRRTKIVKQTLGKFSEEDLVPNEEVVVTVTQGGYIKRQLVTAYRAQKRGGKGVIGMTTKEEDQIKSIQVAKNHDDILFFTNRGRVFSQRVYDVPQASRIAKGVAMVNLIQLSPEEVVTNTLMVESKETAGNFIMITKKGVIKKTEMAKYANIRNSGLIAIKLDEGDELKWICKSHKGDSVIIITRDGQAIHFAESDARLLGRSTRGVRGIKMRAQDTVIGAGVAPSSGDYMVLVVSEKGLGKRTNISQYTLQHRGGLGVKTFKVTERTGKVVGATIVSKDLDADLIMTSKQGQVIRLALKHVSVLGRVTQGVTLMRLKGSDKVASFTILGKEEDEEDIATTPEVVSSPSQEKTASIPKAKKVTSEVKSEKTEKVVKARKIVVEAKVSKPSRLSKVKEPSKVFAKKKIVGAIKKSKSRLSARLVKTAKPKTSRLSSRLKSKPRRK
ncbi:DNA gyrase subunit A [Patescibacteria group bacterium]|nr:DNA gyrase subunit A [Patescibacteria group bacterium]